MTHPLLLMYRGASEGCLVGWHQLYLPVGVSFLCGAGAGLVSGIPAMLDAVGWTAS